MKFKETELPGVFIIEPTIHKDARGYFYESFSQREFEEAIGPVHFVQENQSRSTYAVLRGLHFQKPPYAQAKLVRCVEGVIKDVVVDLRPDSPTYMQHIAVELSRFNHKQLYVPKGFAHGFCVLSNAAVFQYKCDEYYHPEAEGGLNPTDPLLAIDWGIVETEECSFEMSEKDRNRPGLLDFVNPFVNK